MLETTGKNGIKRTYRMAVNVDMIEFEPTDKAIDITENDFESLLDNPDNIDFWKEKFPPNSWIMRGFSLINLMDVTIDQSLASITSNLLIKTSDSFENIRKGMKNLFNNPLLEVGVITLDYDELIPIHKDDVESLLLSANASLSCEEDMCNFTFDQLIQKKQPLAIADVDRFHKLSNSVISKKLIQLKFKSFIIAPLIYEEELLGFIELGAKEKYQLNAVSVSMLDQILPILAMATKRFKTEAQNEMEAIIQQECTTIHHSLKWRFEQEAKNFIANRSSGGQPVFKDIIFKEVYPLYGQLDIKGSSAKRNNAVKSDLIKQLNAVKKVLGVAFQQTRMAAYEELIFRLDTYKEEIRGGLSAGSENKILEFLRSDIYPVFKHLKSDGGKLVKLVNNYEALLDPNLNTLYDERKKYDDSVNLVNQRLASFIDEKQVRAQEIFPHYFERYKTDGIEYNLYIGQSISKDKSFDPIYLQNLRIWQLMVMCEMENEFQKLQKELLTPLEIASLILVYNTPLSVHFRMDEKRFDVEGAYNARYEIIKKRVDKAHIKGTKERVTRPGSIAIIYSQEQDAREYRKYIQFLIAKGYLKNGHKDVELEDLQGITGLRALLVEVTRAEKAKSKKAISVDDLIESFGRTSN